jgi:Ca2+-binding EF-hand superfamily protein
MKTLRRRCLVVAIVFASSVPAVGFAQARATQAPTPRPATPATATKPQARNDATAANLFKSWDGDHNGVLSQQEFVSGWDGTRRRVEAAEQRIVAQFRAGDANHDGAIDATEYANLPGIREAGKAAPPLQAFDGNRDQRLEFREYVAMLRRAAAADARRQPVPATPAPGH